VRSLLACAVLAGLSAACSACGSASVPGGSGTGGSGSTVASSISAGSPLPRVKDSNDLDGDPGSNDDSVIVTYGHAAGASDAHAIAALIKRYYKAAAAEDGARACSMLLAPLAEAVPEEYGSRSDPTDLRGKTCAVVMSKLLKLRHRQIVTQLPSLKVTLVRVGAETALVLLSFATTPEPHKISVGREAGAWKMKELLDSGMP
jgi:hypothetical protein